MCGFIAQFVEHRTGIVEVTGSNPVEALIFFRLLLSNWGERKPVKQKQYLDMNARRKSQQILIQVGFSPWMLFFSCYCFTFDRIFVCLHYVLFCYVLNKLAGSTAINEF